MSRELLQSSLEAHAASGKEGLSITVLRKGRVFGVDVHPDWDRDLLGRSFEDFVKMVLEPAFSQLRQEIEAQDGA